jgi:integrase
MVTRALKEDRAFGKTKSKKSRRRIDLPGTIVAELRAHQKKNRKLQKTTDLVFATTRGTALHGSNFECRHFFPALERAKLRRIRFHDLRHTCASIRLLAGEHPSVIQALLGHSSIRTTLDTYGHLQPTLGKAAAARYDETMG